jgi:pimeloyl-ACP methyl ester carboxylesterase
VGGSIDLISFNVFNPEAGRTLFQQSASDLISIAGRLALAPPTFTVRDGEYPAPQLDTQKMGFFGHSQGGQVGSMALPWFPPQVRAVVISGAGGGVALSAVQRDSSDFDIQALIKTTFEFAPEETLTTAHPLMGLVQLIGEATDPSNFGASWWSEPGPASPSARSVLHIEGVEDPYTPASVSEALAGAALLPVVNELHSSSGILEMRGGPVEVAPILTNRTGWDGQPVTVGLFQVADEGHFAAFYDAATVDAWRTFLETGLSGDARIDRD